MCFSYIVAFFIFNDQPKKIILERARYFHNELQFFNKYIFFRKMSLVQDLKRARCDCLGWFIFEGAYYSGTFG